MDELFCQGIYEEGYGMISQMVMRSELSIGAKALYAYISSFAGAGRTAFPPLALMCNDLGMSEKTIYKCRRELVDNNLITITKNRDGKKYSNNVYTLILNPDNFTAKREKNNDEPGKFERVQNEPSKFEPVQNDRVQETEENSHSSEPGKFEHVQFEPGSNVGTKSNNINNKKKEKEKRKSEFDELIESYTENSKLQETVYEFIKSRKAIKKPVTTLALKKILNRLDNISSNDQEKIEIIETSIMNGWSGVFELKEKSKVIPITKNATPVNTNPNRFDLSKLGGI
ncbi:helix-turn-helix domain-containing protein [Clostridium butyricum]|uniref:helix-turn-helix domain-containing protein n=1 Tax=Clostridium butyricum TaxID=1492 RepID=UPI003465D689